MGEEDRWEELRTALSEHKRTTADGTWWDEGEIRDAVMEANGKGLDVELVFSCREACRSHVDFLRELREMIEDVATRKRRVLAVDDEEDFLGLVKLNLERTRRYEVRTLTDPDGVLEVAREFRPDVILLDVIMPGKDGIELVNELNADPGLRATPVIMLTALASGNVSGGASKDGMLYLAKPVEMKRLVHCIEEHVKAHSGKLVVPDRDGGGDQ